MENTLSKLELSYIDGDGEDILYVVQYNPNTISIEKEVEWNDAEANKKNAPTKEFANGKSKKISIKDIFFDTTTIGNMSVYTNFIEPLEAMAIVRNYTITTDSGTKIVKRPPYITLSWGRSSYFAECVLKKIEYEFKMFTRKGVPTRANVTLSFEEINTIEAEIKEQKAAQTYLTGTGETLPGIAEKIYGNPDKWRIIATANEVDNFVVPAGITLQLPVLS